MRPGRRRCPPTNPRVTAYRVVHQQLRRRRGPASAQLCPCSRPAEQWAYTGPRRPGERYPYSADLSLYAARCRRCHVQQEAEARAAAVA